MIFLRPASFEAFAVHYLRRDARKRGELEEPFLSASEAVRIMESQHSGKVRPWFAMAEWWFVELENWEEMANLVFLADAETRRSQLVPEAETEDSRLLREVGKRAIQNSYLQHFESSKIAQYVAQLASGHLDGVGDNSLTLCALDSNEERWAPSGTLYLHDGAARGMALWLHHLIHPDEPFPRVTAFVALKPGHPVLGHLRESQLRSWVVQEESKFTEDENPTRQGPPIDHFFPKFGEREIKRFLRECDATERVELDRMFTVREVIDSKKGDLVLSTSLYCWPHDPEKSRIEPVTLENLQTPHPSVRHQQAWWDVYFLPLIRQFDQVQDPWVIRIHLAHDLEFLIPHLRHPRVEIRVMDHCSHFTMPGMLWRYLPMEERVTMLARGSDTLWPGRKIVEAIERMLAGPNVLFRRFLPIDYDKAMFLVYRTVPGPIVSKPDLHGGFVAAAQAWIWHQQHGLWSKNVELLGPDGEIYEMPKFAMSHWARYGQDEQFLSHWLYHRAAPQGIHTVIDADHLSGLWSKDWEFVRSKNPSSVLEEV
jgi:hypothetical protein